MSIIGDFATVCLCALFIICILSSDSRMQKDISSIWNSQGFAWCCFTSPQLDVFIFVLNAFLHLSEQNKLNSTEQKCF